MSMDHSKAFTQAAIDVIGMVCGQTLTRGEAYTHHHTQIENAVAVYLGITGQLQGYVLVRFSEENAKALASAMMCGMPVEAIDDMAVSALSELGNMIMGSASTNLAAEGIVTDITTPTLLKGTVQIMQAGMTPLSIPLANESMRVVLDVALRESR